MAECGEGDCERWAESFFGWSGMRGVNGEREVKRFRAEDGECGDVRMVLR